MSVHVYTSGQERHEFKMGFESRLGMSLAALASCDIPWPFSRVQVHEPLQHKDVFLAVFVFE
jgi:hypothetical protein